MFIHLGDRITVSDKDFIGIFNYETLVKSEINSWITANIMYKKTKTVAIGENNDIITSKVSPYTVIKRTNIDKDLIWSRDND